MTNAKTKTRPSENLLTRRKMLQSMTLAATAAATAISPMAAEDRDLATWQQDNSSEFADHSLRIKELASEFGEAMTSHFGDQFDAVINPDGSFWLKGRHVSFNPDSEIEAAFAKWSAAYEALADNEDPSADDSLYEALGAAERACVKLSPHTPRGVAMQFLVFTGFGEFEATKSADHDFQATMLRMANVVPPRGLASSDSVVELFNRLAVLPKGDGA